MKNNLLFLLCFLSLPLHAQYSFDETIFIPLQEEELRDWKMEYQKATDDGTCTTRYIPRSETTPHWSKLLNIQFKDRSLIQVSTALEALEQERKSSPEVFCRVLNQHPNDLTYERSFPTGEHELTRMIMTKKGLHRISFVKRQPFEEDEKNYWLDHLMRSVIGK